jgi:GNAT superfamily N-acetyltransferase
MRIDTATLADAQTLAELNEHVHRLHLEHAPAFFRDPTRQEAADAFRALLGREDTRAFVAYIGDRAVGYVLIVVYERAAGAFSPARRTLYIDQIAVDPGCRRRGVAPSRRRGARVGSGQRDRRRGGRHVGLQHAGPGVFRGSGIPPQDRAAVAEATALISSG